jgi:hypothetical protein
VTDKRAFIPYKILIFTRFLLKIVPLKNGKGKLIDKTFLSRVQFKEKILAVSTLYGARMDVLPNDHVGRHVFFTGTFDRPVSNACAFSRAIPPYCGISAPILGICRQNF